MKDIVSPRSRSLSFRMTGEEFEKLRTGSAARGARCLSEFARTVLLRAVEIPEVMPGPDPYPRLANLEQRIDAIAKNLELLLRKLRPDPATDSPASRLHNSETSLP